MKTRWDKMDEDVLSSWSVVLGEFAPMIIIFLVDMPLIGCAILTTMSLFTLYKTYTILWNKYPEEEYTPMEFIVIREEDLEHD